MSLEIDLTIPDKLLRIVTEPKRFKVLIGGRGSGKTETVAKILAAKCALNGYNILAAREHMNSIGDSVHAVFARNIRQLGIPDFDIQATTIKHQSGGGIIYRGLSRNEESLKSLGMTQTAWIEESQTVSERSIEALTPSIRAAGSEIWLTGNPKSSKDYFSQRFIKPYEKSLRRNGGFYEDDMHMIVFINYLDNPWFPPELEQERQFDYENKPRAKYDHIWLGAFDDSVTDSIIRTEWFDACIDAHERLGFKAQGVEVISHDPSDTGNDSKGLCYRHGSVILDIQERDTGDVNEGGDWATSYALQHKPDVFLWDGDGMGSALRRQFNEALGGKNITLEMFKGSNSPDRPLDNYEGGRDNSDNKTNKDTFRNKRAQYYWELRDRIYRTYQAVKTGKYQDPDTLISFSSGIDELDLLRSEVCRIPLKYNANGYIQIASKQEMKKMGIESPNMADALMMSMANPPADDWWLADESTSFGVAQSKAGY